MHIEARGFFSSLLPAVVALGVAASPRVASATWPLFGRAVCDEASAQQHPVITGDGVGGAIITWQDFRTPTTVIAAQHVLASGDLDAAWPHFGRVLIGTPLVDPAGGQSVETITTDLSGGAIVAWQDDRSSTTGTDIYAQHVLADGQLDPNWPATGVPLCVVDGVQIRPLIVSDAAGGAIVAWTDARPGASVVDLYAQHVLASGLVDANWPTNGLAVCTAAGAQAFPVISIDGDGGALLAWHDLRNPANGSDIYVQHVRVAGAVDAAWPVDGRAVCTAVDAQAEPTILSDGAIPGPTGAIVAWTDARDGTGHIFAHHVLATGAIDPAWPMDGQMLSNTGIESRPVAVSDGAGGAVVTWQRLTSVHQKLFAEHVTAAGVVDPAWPAGGRALSAADNEQTNAQVVSDAAGGAIVAWDSDTNDVFAQHVLASGALDSAYPNTGRVICDLPLQQAFPAMIPTDDGGAIVTWLDNRTGSTDIYAMQVLDAAPTGAIDRVPSAIAFAPAFPNPAHASLTLRFNLPAEAPVRLTIYDVTGRRVRELAAGPRPAGDNVLGWDLRDDRGREVSSGVYFARLESGQATLTQKLVKVR